MGLPVNLVLIALGAVLAFAVHQHPGAAVDVHVVGWVLLAVGFAGLLLSLFWWDRFGPGYWGYAGRGWGHRGPRTVVEEEGPVAPADPYDVPPPP